MRLEIDQIKTQYFLQLEQKAKDFEKKEEDNI